MRLICVCWFVNGNNEDHTYLTNNNNKSWLYPNSVGISFWLHVYTSGAGPLLQHINLVITVPADALAPNSAMPSVEPELTIISDVIFQKFGGYEPINRKRVGV